MDLTPAARLGAIFSHPSALPLLRPWWERAQPLLANDADRAACAAFLSDFGGFLFPDAHNPLAAPWTGEALALAYSAVAAALTAAVAGHENTITEKLLTRSERLTSNIRWI